MGWPEGWVRYALLPEPLTMFVAYSLMTAQQRFHLDLTSRGYYTDAVELHGLFIWVNIDH